MSGRERLCWNCAHVRINEQGALVCKRNGRTYGDTCSAEASCGGWVDRDENFAKFDETEDD